MTEIFCEECWKEERRLKELGGKMKPEVFVIDVDGCLTDGKMYYTAEGKVMKAFGPDDHDALNVLAALILIRFVTADERGYLISLKRILYDMGFGLELIGTGNRLLWLEKRGGLCNVIYMGDGILDIPIFEKVGYSICPSDGFYLAKEKASFVTQSPGGHRAVAEACVHIKEKFFV